MIIPPKKFFSKTYMGPAKVLYRVKTLEVISCNSFTWHFSLKDSSCFENMAMVYSVTFF